MNELIIPKLNEDPISLLRRCGGWYECPKDAEGNRLGPLVGYAGRDEQNRQYVGDIYANFSVLEENSLTLGYIAERLKAAIPLVEYLKHSAVACCGMPIGGLLLASALSREIPGARCIFPEKKVLEVASAASREKSVMSFGRHTVRKGESVIIVEDVVNNVSTTEQAIGLVHSQGGTTVAIVCFLNRSLKVDSVFTTRGGFKFPIISLVRKPIAQYAQDDPAVAQDIATGNVVWKPKNEWAKLEGAMARAAQ